MAWQTSYATVRNVRSIWTYDRLRDEVLSSQLDTVNFLMEVGVLSSQECPKCGSDMNLSKSRDFSDGYCFRCQKQALDSLGGEIFCNEPYFSCL